MDRAERQEVDPIHLLSIHHNTRVGKNHVSVGVNVVFLLLDQALFGLKHGDAGGAELVFPEIATARYVVITEEDTRFGRRLDAVGKAQIC